ncbi:MAG: REP-associated tyrosine transposase [Pseudomonadota bacterium]
MTLCHGHHLRRGRHSSAGLTYLVTTVTHERRPIFQDFTAARLLIANMRRLQDEARLDSLAFVVMPDHLHWLFSLRPAHALSEVLRLLKGRTARRLNLQRQANGEVWQEGFHDHALRREEDLQATARYIIGNPVRAGLVQSVRAYPHWDAIWF